MIEQFHCFYLTLKLLSVTIRVTNSNFIHNGDHRMSKLPLTTLETVDDLAKPIFNHAKTNFGMIPNFFAAIGIDGASLSGFLAFQETLNNNAQLTAKQRELIALAVANYNGCHYCVSGHTFSAKRIGLTPEECVNAQKGKNTDAKDQAIIDLALNILKTNAHLTDEMLTNAKNNGVTDQEIIQITALTALNTLSNWVNNIVDPTIDFPKVDLISNP